MPINLSYHASGNKTENHSSWVGLGWNLSAGGSISRIINGVRDDLLKENWISETHTPCGPSNEWSYYWGSGFPTGFWYQESFIQGIFNNRQICGSNEDTQPDEFVFNFLNYTGSFFFVNEGGHISIKFKSKDNIQFKIEPVFSTSDIEFDIFKNNPIHPGEHLKAKAYRTFVMLILTDKNGVKYEFGGDPTSNIDFTTSNGITIATSWHLSKIISPLGNEIILNYKSDGEIIEKSKASFFSADVNFENPGEANIQRNDIGINGLSISLIHPKYLLQITTSNNQTIDFISSKSMDLDYDDWVSDESNIRTAFTGVLNDNINPHGTVWDSDLIDSHYDLKLDQINISSLMKIGFRYVENIYQRLRLDKFILASFDSDLINDPTMQKYTFEYNPVFLPDFNERKSDNNGYFNNIDYSGIAFGPEFHNLMSATRQPVEEFMKAEILEKIHYPTGGVTLLEYQPHDYSKLVQPLLVGDQSFQLTPQAGISGGLRIWKITSFPDENDQNRFLKKTYTYKNLDGSSSDILSGTPQYYAEGDLHIQYDYSFWMDLVHFHFEGDYFRNFYQYSQHPILPLSNTNGNHITYSRVIEKNEDESYTVFTFTNHEEYPDEVPIMVYTNNDGNQLFGEFTSREIERGLLKSTEKFNDANRLIEKVVYAYNQNPDRYNDFVKKVDQHFFYNEFRFSANKIYTFTPYLNQEVGLTYIYNEDGTNNTIRTVKDYDYKNKLLSQIVTTLNQNNPILKTIYKYPQDVIQERCIQSYENCMKMAAIYKNDRDEVCNGYAECLAQSNDIYIQDTTNCGQTYRNCQSGTWLNNNYGLVLKKMIDKNIVSYPIEI